MKVESIVVGELQENCYLIGKDDKYLLVDPGEDTNKILDFIKDKDIIGILVTHGHHDHIGALSYLIDHFHYSVYDRFCLSEGIVKIGPFNIEIIYTPGHKEDCVTYYFREEKYMFTGDFLFKGTVGRCDLDGGNWRDMVRSIQKIRAYDDDIEVFPGHGESTILGKEKRYNPYFREGM